MRPSSLPDTRMERCSGWKATCATSWACVSSKDVTGRCTRGGWGGRRAGGEGWRQLAGQKLCQATGNTRADKVLGTARCAAAPPPPARPPHLCAPVPEQHLVAAACCHQRAVGAAGQQLQARDSVAAGRAAGQPARKESAGQQRAQQQRRRSACPALHAQKGACPVSVAWPTAQRTPRHSPLHLLPAARVPATHGAVGAA